MAPGLRSGCEVVSLFRWSSPSRSSNMALATCHKDYQFPIMTQLLILISCTICTKYIHMYRDLTDKLSLPQIQDDVLWGTLLASITRRRFWIHDSITAGICIRPILQSLCPWLTGVELCQLIGTVVNDCTDHHCPFEHSPEHRHRMISAHACGTLRSSSRSNKLR